MPPYPITRAEISRERLVGNFKGLRALVRRESDADLLAVVKADAYGHSALLCAPWLVESGASWLGVTCAEEGVAVRRVCPTAKILVMSGVMQGEAEHLLDAQLVPTVWTPQHLESLAEIVSKRQCAAGGIPVHVEVDTGMSRQGVRYAGREMTEFLERLREIPALKFDGVFTHFASAEVLDSEQNAEQMERFREAVQHVFAAGFRPQWLHAGSSATLLGQRQIAPLAALAKEFNTQLLLRPGIALYGYALPFSGDEAKPLAQLKPVLAWKTTIAAMRDIAAGTKIGYNGTFVAPTPMRLALLPVGYADGLNRKLSNRGHVLVREVAAPIVGRVSMDLTIVDISGIPEAAAGDEVVILGEQNGLRITADDHARWAETISYEILCAIGARVPRVACE